MTSLSVFFDNTLDSTRLIYKDAALNRNYTLRGCYNDTATAYDTGLTFLFSGVSAEFYGIAGGYPPDPLLQVIIDGASTTDHTLTSLEYIDLLYKSPTLPDGPHNITFVQSIDNPTLLDFMLVTTGSETSLSGNDPIIVDSDDPSIAYEGYWTRNDSVISNPNVRARKPFKGSFHQTQHGTASFSFNGTSVGVYGVYDRTTAPHPDDIIFFIDGAAYNMDLVTIPLNTSTNHRWYYVDALAPTSHSLVIQFNPATAARAWAKAEAGPTFSLDYILYNPLPRERPLRPSNDFTIPAVLLGFMLLAFVVSRFRRHISIISSVFVKFHERRPEYWSLPSKAEDYIV